jgi:hypothetical protein
MVDQLSAIINNYRLDDSFLTQLMFAVDETGIGQVESIIKGCATVFNDYKDIRPEYAHAAQLIGILCCYSQYGARMLPNCNSK